MAEIRSLILPEPPSANRYWRVRVSRGVLGRHLPMTYKSREARAYQEAVRNIALAAGLRPVPIGQQVRVTLHWYAGSLRGDLDNRIKVLIDALQGSAYENDRQVFELHAFRTLDRGNARMEVTVEALPQAPKPTG